MERRTASSRPATAHVHAVRFYENKASLCRTVADFLGEGFAVRQPALVIATPSHREALLHEVRSRGVAVDQLRTSGDLLLLDARDMLAKFMVNGVPDGARFSDAAADAIERVSGGHSGRTIRAYGEMVDVLWQDGLTNAAIQLEMLWNQLATTHDFSLLCGYAIGSFYKDAGMRQVCAQHSHVLPTDEAGAYPAAGSIS